LHEWSVQSYMSPGPHSILVHSAAHPRPQSGRPCVSTRAPLSPHSKHFWHVARCLRFTTSTCTRGFAASATLSCTGHARTTRNSFRFVSRYDDSMLHALQLHAKGPSPVMVSTLPVSAPCASHTRLHWKSTSFSFPPKMVSKSKPPRPRPRSTLVGSSGSI